MHEAPHARLPRTPRSAFRVPSTLPRSNSSRLPQSPSIAAAWKASSQPSAPARIAADVGEVAADRLGAAARDRARRPASERASARTEWPSRAQPLDQPPADEARAAGDEHAAHVGRRLAEARAARRGARRDDPGVQIQPFAIERFYERWEFRAELMLSSSDCESRSLAELLALEPDADERLLATAPRLHRGGRVARAARGGRRAATSARGPEDVLALAAAEEGIFIAYHALLAPGDHAVVEAPCYGSAIEVARSTGARREPVAAPLRGRLGARPRRARAPAASRDAADLHQQPAQPDRHADVAGGVRARRRARARALDRAVQRRGLPRSRARRGRPAAARRATSTSARSRSSTVSKAHGLPGLRIGWLGCRDAARCSSASGS